MGMFQSLRKKLIPDWQCCFCGQGVEAKSPDPCRMVLTYNDAENPDMAQETACHVACLKEHLHKSVAVPY
jgi:hypothetical protein